MGDEDNDDSKFTIPFCTFRIIKKKKKKKKGLKMQLCYAKVIYDLG